MSCECCREKQVTVTIQENGIIRGPSGGIICRIDTDIPFDSAKLEPIKTISYEDMIVKIADYIEGEDWSGDDEYTTIHAKTIVDIILRHKWVDVINPTIVKDDIRKYKI